MRSEAATRVRPSRRGRLRSATVGTVATGLAGQAALIITGPLVARLLGPEDRGYFAALVLWPSVLVTIGTLGVPSAVTYYTARGSLPFAAARRAAATFGALQAAPLLLAHAAILGALYLGEDTSVRSAALLTLALAPVSLAHHYGLALLQGAQRFTAFNVLRLLPALGYALGIVVLFAAGGDSLVAVVLVWVGAYAAAAAATTLIAFALRRGPTEAAGPATTSRRALLGFGLRGLLVTASPLETMRIDQIALALFLAPEALGFYVVGLAFTQLPGFVARSVAMVAFPRIAASTDAVLGRAVMWRFVWLTTAVNLAIGVALFVSAGWLLPLLFGESFQEAVTIAQVLLPGAILLGVRRVLAESLRGRGDPVAGTIGELAGLAALAVALAVALPLWELVGVAASITVSHAVALVALVAWARVRGEVRLDEALAALASLRR